MEGGEGLGDGEEDDAVAEERGEGTDEEDEPWGKLVAGDSREEAEVFADVDGHTEERDVALVKAQD